MTILKGGVPFGACREVAFSSQKFSWSSWNLVVSLCKELSYCTLLITTMIKQVLGTHHRLAIYDCIVTIQYHAETIIVYRPLWTLWKCFSNALPDNATRILFNTVKRRQKLLERSKQYICNSDFKFTCPSQILTPIPRL